MMMKVILVMSIGVCSFSCVFERSGLAFCSSELEHLSVEQEGDLCAVLDRFSYVFSDRPSSCDLFEHSIKLVDGFQAK